MEQAEAASIAGVHSGSDPLPSDDYMSGGALVDLGVVVARLVELKRLGVLSSQPRPEEGGGGEGGPDEESDDEAEAEAEGDAFEVRANIRVPAPSLVFYAPLLSSSSSPCSH